MSHVSRAAAVAALVLIASAAGAQSTQPAQGPQQTRLLLAVSEGTSGGGTPQDVIDKYKPLGDTIGKVLKATVIIEPARNFQRLEDGIRAKRYDLAMARPSDYPARGVRDFGYRYVAHAKPDGQCVFIVKGASPARALADFRGKRIVLPEQVSYMARFCSAELRDAGFDLSKVQYVKEQEVVVYQLQNGNADLGGVASYSKAIKGLGDAGLRELERSRPQPYFPLIAGPRISNSQIAAIRKELVKLSETPAGRALVAKLGISGFDDAGEKRLGELLGWLEKR